MRSLRVIATLAAALVLSGCTSSTPVTTITAIPSLAVHVPLTNVVCSPTPSDQCDVFGVSEMPSGALADQSQIGLGHDWVDNSAYLSLGFIPSASACSSTACYFAGQYENRDALRALDLSTNQVTTVAAPTDGLGIVALWCRDALCADVDLGGSPTLPRLSISTDGGLTWSTPAPLTGAKAALTTGVGCISATSCVVGYGAVHAMQIWRTSDAGATWSTSTSSAVLVNDFTCTAVTCLAASQSNTSARVVAVLGHMHALSTGLLTAMACADDGRCVALKSGHGGTEVLKLSHLNSAHPVVTTVSVSYLSEPLVSVACGARTCVAVSASGLVSVTP